MSGLWVGLLAPDLWAQDTLTFTVTFDRKDYQVVSEAGYDRIALGRYGPYATGSHGTIRLALPPKNKGNIRLALYDASGRLAALLHEGELEAGYHDFRLDKGLSSGVYFLRLETLDETRDRKIILR